MISSIYGAADHLRRGSNGGVLAIFLVAALLGVATPYSYFLNPERGLFVIILVIFLFIALFSVLGSAEHEMDKFGIQETVMGRSSLVGHAGGISVVEVSCGPDQRIVSGSFDGTVRTWRLQSGKHEFTYVGHTGAVFAVAVSRVGMVVSGGADRTIQVWDLHTGEHSNTLLGHTDSILTLRVVEPPLYHCNDTLVVSGGHDGAVMVWSVSSGDVLQRLEAPQGEGATERHLAAAMTTIAVSVGPDPVIVAGTSLGAIHLWQLNSGLYLGRLDGHFGAVLSVTLSPSICRPLIVSCSEDWTVRVWDLRRCAHLRTLDGHSGSVGSVAICGGADDEEHSVQVLPSDSHTTRVSGSLHLIVSGGRDSTLRIWDLYTGELYVTLEDHTDSVCALALSLSAFPPWACPGACAGPGLTTSSSMKDIQMARMKQSSGALSLEGRVTVDGPCAAPDTRPRSPSSIMSLIWGDGDPPEGPKLARHHSNQKPCALIITGGVESNIKIWDLEKIKMDLHWQQRRSWAVMVAACRAQCMAGAEGAGAGAAEDPSCPVLVALAQKPGFQKFIFIDDLCRKVATYF